MKVPISWLKDFVDIDLSIEDLAQLIHQKQLAPVTLIGHSLGGAAVLQAAAGIPSARASISSGVRSSGGGISSISVTSSSFTSIVSLPF